jgi:hypothetical protein
MDNIIDDFETNRLQSHYNLFKNYIEIDHPNSPILKGYLPSLIFSQLKNIVSKVRLTKDQNYSFLKDNLHQSVDNFSYRPYIPNYLLEPTFIFEYIRSLGAYFYSKFFNLSFEEAFNKVKVNELDEYNYLMPKYDIWINYSTKNTKSNLHAHKGNFSGIIFVENSEVSTTFFPPNLSIKGNPGEILLFNSFLPHSVYSNSSNLERVTISFNLNIIN